MKAKKCDECKFADMTNDKLICGKEHKPRFYLPVGQYPWFENDWGWKRRCDDFEKGTPKGIVVECFPVFNATDSGRGPADPVVGSED